MKSNWLKIKLMTVFGNKDITNNLVDNNNKTGIFNLRSISSNINKPF